MALGRSSPGRSHHGPCPGCGPSRAPWCLPRRWGCGCGPAGGAALDGAARRARPPSPAAPSGLRGSAELPASVTAAQVSRRHGGDEQAPPHVPATAQSPTPTPGDQLQLLSPNPGRVPRTWFTAPESREHMADTLASPTVVPVKSTPLETRECRVWTPWEQLPPGAPCEPAWPCAPPPTPPRGQRAPPHSPPPGSRDELRVVMQVSRGEVSSPPGQEVVQGGVGVRADGDFVPTVPDLQAHKHHTEVELLIKL